MDFALVSLIGFGLIAYVVILIFISIAIADAAKKKGQSWGLFFWLSLLVNWFIMLIVMLLIKKDPAHSAYEAGDLGSTPVSCEFCKEQIRADAIVCKHCGRDIKPQLLRLQTEHANKTAAAEELAIFEAEERNAAWIADAPNRKKRNKSLLIVAASVIILLVSVAVLYSFLPKPTPFAQALSECSITDGYTLADANKTLILHESMGYEKQFCFTAGSLALEIFGNTGVVRGSADYTYFDKEYLVTWTSTDTDKAEITFTEK